VTTCNRCIVSAPSSEFCSRRSLFSLPKSGEHLHGVLSDSVVVVATVARKVTGRDGAIDQVGDLGVEGDALRQVSKARLRAEFCSPSQVWRAQEYSCRPLC